MQFIHHNRGQRQPFLKRPPFNYRNDRFMFNINMHWIYRAEILSALCHKPVINRATLLAIKVDDLVDEKKPKKKNYKSCPKANLSSRRWAPSIKGKRSWHFAVIVESWNLSTNCFFPSLFIFHTCRSKRHVYIYIHAVALFLNLYYLRPVTPW